MVFSYAAYCDFFFFQRSALAYDITEKFSIGGALAGAYQHQTGDDIDDKGRGAISFQPEFSLRPNENDVQYMADEFDNDEDDISGIIPGIRGAVES